MDDEINKLNPANFTPEFMQEFEEAGFLLAEKKIVEVAEKLAANPPEYPLLPRLATGGGFTGFFFWDTSFNEMWAKYAPKRFPVTSSLDNFYNLQEDDGFICREFLSNGKPYWSKKHPVSFNPPIMAWAELELFEAGATDKKRLEYAYSHLKKHHDFCWKTYRRDDGLFFSDVLGCGMDDLPRFPKTGDFDAHGGIEMCAEYVLEPSKSMWYGMQGKAIYSWNRQLGWVDTSSQMAFNALNLARIAETVGKTEDAAQLRKQHAEMKEIINGLCYDPKRGFYFDFYDGKVIPRYSAAGFWPMLAEVVPQECVAGIVKVLTDPAIFNRPVPFPTLGACEPEYDPENGYWRGAAWPPTTYVALRGLRKVGEEELAKHFAKRWYNAIAETFRREKTLFENISSEQIDHPKNRSMRDYCGWGVLTPVAIYREFLKG